MAYIDSSAPTSGLASAAKPLDDDEDLDAIPEEQEDVPVRQPKERPPRPGSAKAKLVEDIDDINLARYIDQQQLDTIGMEAVREYEIDELSRKDWLDKAIRAMKFATQEAAAKEFPWAGASNVIFPLISQSAIDFASRTYPAIVQNRSVVKGVVWGSDRGTPVMKDGQPVMEAQTPPSGLMEGPPAAAGPPAGPGAPDLGGGAPQTPPQAPPGPPQAPPQPVWLIAPGEKRKRADRIADHMSWQLLDEMVEWEPQMDQMLHQIPIAGGAARKTYFDPLKARNRSLVVPLVNLVWNYHAASFEDAARHTEKILLYPHQITEMERYEAEFDADGQVEAGGEGMFLPIEYGVGGGAEGQMFGYDEQAVSSDASDPNAPHFFIEQHCRLDLDEDDYPEPYIVTVHLRSQKVVRIVARYDEEGITATEDDNTITKIDAVEHYTLFPFLPSLDGGSYPTGFGHLLKPLNSAINTVLNQMIDAGTLQNAGGGFIGDSLGMPSGQTLFQVGKFTRVNTKGAAIRDAVFPIPFPGPSTALFQLLGVLIAAGKELASIGNILQGDAAIANAPPTTVLALIEQGMKVYNAINKRIFRAEKAELDKLYRLNRKHLKETARFRRGDEFLEVTPDDYRLGGGVEPIADPTMTTDMQKLARAQILMGFNGDPLIDQTEIRRRLFEAANMDRIDELFVPPDPTAAQMGMARAQAELGKVRAEELKNQTQAFLNMANARAVTDEKDRAFIENQLVFLRLNIEATNTQIRAAAVDHKFHDTNVWAGVEGLKHLTSQMSPGGGATPTPAPGGDFPDGPDSTPALPPVDTREYGQPPEGVA